MSDISGPEYLDASSGAPLTQPTGSRSKFGMIAAVAVAVLGLVGAGAWAATAFFSDGAQPAEALPSTTLAYVSLDVEPSGEQQLEAYRFLKKFPAFEEAVDLDEGADPREQLFNWIQDQGDCEGLDYAEEIEPWLGSSAALAAIDLGNKEPSPVAVVQVEDADAAEAGLKKLQSCSESDDSGGWTFAGDWAIIAEDEGAAEDVVAATEEGSLADSAEHNKWLDELGDLGVMTMYVGPDALDKAMEIDDVLGEPGVSELIDEYQSLANDFGGMAATLRFNDEDMEFVVASDASISGAKLGGTQAGESVARLPEDTAAALGISVGDGFADKILDQLAKTVGSDQDVEQLISEIEQQTGLVLPQDLQTLMGDAMVLAVGDDIDLDQIANSADGADVPIGLKITGNPEDIESVVDKIRVAVDGLFGSPAESPLLGSDSSGETVAIGPSSDYRAQLLDEGALGESATFGDVVGDVEDASAVLFIDFDAADNWLDQAIEESGDQDAIDNILPLRAFGMQAEVDGDVAHITLRISTD